MENFYECTFPAGPEEGLTPVWQTVHQLQQAAVDHAELLDCGRTVMLEQYNAIWMIVRSWLHFDEPPRDELPLTVRTWSRGLSRASTYRDFDLIQAGRRIGEAVQVWVTVDADERKLCNMAKITQIAQISRPEYAKTYRPGKPVCEHPLTEYPPLMPEQQDLDINGHVNNASYLRLALQAMPRPLSTLKTLEISYSRECFAGQPMPFLAWQQDASCYIRCLTPSRLPAFDLSAETF